MRDTRKYQREKIVLQKRQRLGGGKIVEYKADGQAASLEQIMSTKSDIYQICCKIKSDGNEQLQMEGIDQLNNYLCQNEKNSDSEVFSSKIFQILETGVTKQLMFMIQNSTNVDYKRKLS